MWQAGTDQAGVDLILAGGKGTGTGTGGVVNLQAASPAAGTGSAQNALTTMREKYGQVIIPEALSERAAVRKAIALRRPVWVSTRGSGHLKAAQEWRAACTAILARLDI